MTNCRQAATAAPPGGTDSRMTNATLLAASGGVLFRDPGPEFRCLPLGCDHSRSDRAVLLVAAYPPSMLQRDHERSYQHRRLKLDQRSPPPHRIPADFAAEAQQRERPDHVDIGGHR
jgi:hypothetical protein